jgi:hypothetical protein
VGALADVQLLTQNGVPVLPVPVFPETGLPNFVMPVGTPSVLPPSAGTGTGTGGDGTTGGTPADDLLSSRSWGAAAVQNAQTLGVNATAIAATCMLESGCQNIGGPGSVSGAFQMTNGTYTQDIDQALAQNPSLAGTIDTSLAGKMDPANESIAAAQDLKNAATALQNAGISNPTLLDARAYYQWGSGGGPYVAQASDGTNLSELLSKYYTAAQLAANGVTPSTTVGQWRQTIVDKVGSAATQPVLT